MRARREELNKLLHQEERLAVLPSEVVTTRTQQNRILKLVSDSELSIHYNVPEDPLHLVQLQAAEAAGKPVLRVNPSQPVDEIALQIRAELQKAAAAATALPDLRSLDDAEQVGALANYFSQADGCKVLEPQPGESYHRAKLDESDGILFFHRNAPEPWLDKHREALLQGAALRKQPRPEAWYFVRPGAPLDLFVQKDPLRPQWTITRVGELNLTDLQPFADAFRSCGAATA